MTPPRTQRVDADAVAGPLVVVLNVGSGHGDPDETCGAIATVVERAGRAHRMVRVERPDELAEIARKAVAEAQALHGAVVAAGGDGTLSTVAQVALSSGVPFGVIPQGTFNYFGRTHGISSDAVEATEALLRARPHPVQVGLVNERVFLVNASLGLYPQLIEDRETQKRIHGRSRLVAMWAMLVTLLRGFRPMRIRLAQEGRFQELRALTLVIGNNRLQLEQIGLTEAAVVEDGRLAAILVKPIPTLALLWLALKGAIGELGKAGGVVHFALSHLTVTPAGRRAKRMRLAIDGELVWMDAPIEFRVAPEPLLLLLTPHDAREPPAAAR